MVYALQLARMKCAANIYIFNVHTCWWHSW